MYVLVVVYGGIVNYLKQAEILQELIQHANQIVEQNGGYNEEEDDFFIFQLDSKTQSSSDIIWRYEEQLQ